MFLLAILLLQATYCIEFDRSIYTTQSANIQHDSYMVFSNYTSKTLKLQWRQTYAEYGYCVIVEPYPSMVFANGNIYCIANASDDGQLYNLDEVIVAINVSNEGNTIWTKHSLQPQRLNADSLMGITYIPSKNYLALSEETLGIITLLDANTGNLVSNISFPGIPNRNCPNREMPGGNCIDSFIMGTNNGIIGWYDGEFGHINSSVISFNLVDSSKDNNNIMNDPKGFESIASVCGDVLISTNQYDVVNGYEIDENLNIIKRLWSYNVNPKYDESYIFPPVCIMFNDGSNSSQLLFSPDVDDENNEIVFILMDVKSGNVLDRDIKWGYDSVDGIVIPPAIYTGDQSEVPLLVYNDGENTICYKVNSGGYKTWSVLWKYNGPKSSFLIVNEVLYQSDITTIQALDMLTGKEMNKVSFDEKDDITDSILMAGQDMDNNVWIVALCYLQPIDYVTRTVVYAFN